jgi:tRNA dimethylallyltransferase
VAPDLIVIAGPTASGKSNLAVRYARYLRDNFDIKAEIINADRVQLYNELKILTAYPSDDLQRLINHHLYGILSPHETSSVAAWLGLAEKKIQQLRAEGKIAVICGGTGLYINSLINGISNIPEIPLDFRNEVQEKFRQLGRDNFFDLLTALDPELCKTLHRNNTQRILRAYEVASYTGKPLSEWWKDKKNENKYRTFSLILLPPRDKLNERCLARIEKMMHAGVVIEVKNFIEKYPGYDGFLKNTLGYGEIISLLKGGISIDECVRLMHIQIKQYAKRQYVWFRNQMKSSKIICEFGETISCDKNFACQ